MSMVALRSPLVAVCSQACSSSVDPLCWAPMNSQGQLRITLLSELTAREMEDENGNT